MATTMVHIRMNEEVRSRAAAALEAMGLSVSDAVRVFLTRVATEQRIPFPLEVPNATTRAAFLEGDKILSQHKARYTSPEALFESLEK